MKWRTESERMDDFEQYRCRRANRLRQKEVSGESSREKAIRQIRLCCGLGNFEAEKVVEAILAGQIESIRVVHESSNR